MKVLICGHKSFAASGLREVLHADGHEVYCFSRGNTGRMEHEIWGDVFKMDENPYLQNGYDVVINFIIIKNADVVSNIGYIRSLLRFCERTGTKRLVQISSISVYPNEAREVNEWSHIETCLEKKGSYARVKIAVDQVLSEAKIKVSFVRPGFIVSGEKPVSSAGILRRFPLGFGLLLGGHQTPLPLLDRGTFHRALARLIRETKMPEVCLMFSNCGGTKLSLAREMGYGYIIVLPMWLVCSVAAIACKCRLLSFSQYHQILGLYKNTHFDSTQTEKRLGVSFG
jgi:nucleoside-diphosphate-sugar epimerase